MLLGLQELQSCMKGETELQFTTNSSRFYPSWPLRSQPSGPSAYVRQQRTASGRRFRSAPAARGARPWSNASRVDAAAGQQSPVIILKNARFFPDEMEHSGCEVSWWTRSVVEIWKVKMSAVLQNPDESDRNCFV